LGFQPDRDDTDKPTSRGDPPQPLLVSATDAARVLAIGRTTIYELVKAGHLTPIHIRSCVRFSMHEIEQFVESLSRGTQRAA
jgi:excisionase family DNA binding protein